MDKLKSAVGLDKKDQEGKEPVSGETGEGTTAQPFDQGNSAETTETADQSKTYDEKTNGDVGNEVDRSQQHAIGGASEESSAEKKGGIGGFFKSTFGSSKDKTADESAEKPVTAGAEEQKQAPPSPKLPPNQFGESVPPGLSTDIGAPNPDKENEQTPTTEPTQAKEPKQAEAKKDTKEPSKANNMSSEDKPTFTSPFGNNESVETPKDTVADNTNRSASGAGKPQQLKASRAYSVASPAADKSRRNPQKSENPNAIPTAGGIRMGERAYEARERRKSEWQGSSVGSGSGIQSGLAQQPGSPNPNAIAEENEVANASVPQTNTSTTNAMPQSTAGATDVSEDSSRADSKTDSAGKTNPQHAVSAANKDRKGSSGLMSKLGLGKHKEPEVGHGTK